MLVVHAVTGESAWHGKCACNPSCCSSLPSSGKKSVLAHAIAHATALPAFLKPAATPLL